MQISGSGIVAEVDPKGFKLHVENDILHGSDRWYYYSMYPAWYKNYPVRYPDIGDRVAITAVYNEKSNAWHLKNFAYVTGVFHEEEEGETMQEEGPISENSGNFVGTQMPDSEQNSPVPVEYVALELACQVAPALMQSWGQSVGGKFTGDEIVAMAKQFKKFLENK